MSRGQERQALLAPYVLPDAITPRCPVPPRPAGSTRPALGRGRPRPLSRKYATRAQALPGVEFVHGLGPWVLTVLRPVPSAPVKWLRYLRTSFSNGSIAARDPDRIVERAHVS
jgi:hypothetical protein